MTVSLLTYNVLFNNALLNLQKVLDVTHPDIVCLQEIETNETNLKNVEKHGYKLADYSNSFIKFGKVWGLATFFNPETLSFIDSLSLRLPRSYYEFLLVLLRGGNNPRTVLRTEFINKENNKKLINYNLHLTAWGTNGIRAKQIKAAFDDMDISSKGSIIIAGDFNYPYQRKQFEELIEKYELKEATSNLFYTLESKFFRLLPIKIKVDYILYKNLQLVKTERISSRESDHFPIMSTFEI